MEYLKITKWKQEKRLITKKQNEKLKSTRTTQDRIIPLTASHAENTKKKQQFEISVLKARRFV